MWSHMVNFNPVFVSSVDIQRNGITGSHGNSILHSHHQYPRILFLPPAATLFSRGPLVHTAGFHVCTQGVLTESTPFSSDTILCSQ